MLFSVQKYRSIVAFREFRSYIGLCHATKKIRAVLIMEYSILNFISESLLTLKRPHEFPRLLNISRVKRALNYLRLFEQQFTLGISSLSKLGPIGATIEVAVILYLAATSAIGLYALPGVKRVQPKLRSTPLTHIIANCALLLVLSSALPLLSRILGKFWRRASCCS